MADRKGLRIFLVALALIFTFLLGWNIIIDPFGVFGSVPMKWDSYAETLNPYCGKPIYVSKHCGDFDSYVVGSSSAASFQPKTLEKYLGGSFYNMSHYGADIEYDRRLVSYLLKHDPDVRNIVLVVGIDEALRAASPSDKLTDKPYYKLSDESFLSYYSSYIFSDFIYADKKLNCRKADTEFPQSFDCYDSATGCYDKRLRDAESIGSIDPYLLLHGRDFKGGGDASELENIDACVSAISQIKAECRQHGVNLLVICPPEHESRIHAITEDSLNEFYNSLAQNIDYWNFAVTPISRDARYFYDTTHARNATADMVLARIFKDAESYYPEFFGHYCCRSRAISVAEWENSTAEIDTANVPILLYHHISDTAPESATVISPGHFREHMRLLRNYGYHVVSLKELMDYVYYGTPLPEKPVVITFDDGYYSNYEYAYPILSNYGYPATIFAVGSSFGHYEYYKNTSHKLTPHFGKAEAIEMIDSGLISIQSHTYDMHQYLKFEPERPERSTIVKLDKESDEDYIRCLREDSQKQAKLFSRNGLPDVFAIAFPKGEWDYMTNVVLLTEGYQMTFSTNKNRINTLICGMPQSLISLGRFTVAGNTTGSEILNYLSQCTK